MTDRTLGARCRFTSIILADFDLMALLVAIRSLRLPQWRLVAGCLYQTVWNVLTGRARGTGIQDYDLIYFDATDLSWEAEDAVIGRVTEAARGCVGPVQARNQARVHLWFEDHFGIQYPKLTSADEAIGRFDAIAAAVGVRLDDNGRLDVVAPFGLDDLFAMVVRPNYALDNAATFRRKSQRRQSIWPEIKVIPWDRDERAQELIATRE